MLTNYPRIPTISNNIQLFAEIVNDICSQIYLRNECPLTLSKTQLQIVKTLNVANHKSASSLSEVLHLSRPAITQQVDKLIQMELVSRQTDSKDRRAVDIGLTETGQELVASYEEYILARQANILNNFTYDERDIFNRSLEKFIKLCMENEDNLEILCLNCEGRYKEYCRIHQHRHICHVEQSKSRQI